MILAGLIKDLQILARDKGALASMFLLPFVFIVTFGFLFRGAGDDAEGDGSGPVARLTLAIHGGEDTADARAFVRTLGDLQHLALRRTAGEEELERLVSREEVSAGLLLPEGFTFGREPGIVLVRDAAISDVERAMLVGTLRGALEKAYWTGKYGAFIEADDGRAATVPLQERAPRSSRERREGIDSFQVTVPGNAVLFVFFLALPLAITFIEERKKGTWRRHLAAPVSRLRMLVAKLFPFYLMGLVQMLVLFLAGALIFGMDVSGSVGALLAITLAVNFAAVGFGFLLASFGGSERAISSIGSIVLLIMGLLSGCMFPRFLMPEGFKAVGLAFPHGWALDAYQDVLVRSGTGIGDVLLPVLVLFGFGALFAGIGAAIFRFER